MASLSSFLTSVAVGLFAAASFLFSSASAQDLRIEPSFPNRTTTTQNQGLRGIGQTVDTGIGEVGQRQSTANTAPNVNPAERVNNRIQNRVQNRLINRIDRYYAPRDNAAGAFDEASARVRETSSG